jgi:hypothetical protein
MSTLIKVGKAGRLTLSELYALDGRDISMMPKFKGHVILEFRNKYTGKLEKRREIFNTRTWMFRNLVQQETRIDTNANVFIANDDGDWHIHKSIARCTYQDNGGTFFVDTAPTSNVYPSSYIFEYISQFHAAPAGTTKTINVIGLCMTDEETSGVARVASHVLAATRLTGAGETQDEYTNVDVTYKLTFTI